MGSHMLSPIFPSVSAAQPSISSTPVQVEGPELFTILARWQRSLEVSGRANANTMRQYRNALFAWCAHVAMSPAWTGPRDPLAVTEDDVVAYLADITPKGGYRSQVMKALVSFYRWASTRGVMAHNPCAMLHPHGERQVDAPALEAGELRRLLVSAEQVDPRARWAIQLQYATACRAGSLVAVMPQDVGWSPPYITFRTAKNDDPYGVQLNEAGETAARKLYELLDYTPTKVATRLPTLVGVGYAGYRRWVKAAALAAGVEAWTHLIRHTTITRLAEDPTVDVRTIMGIANWKDPRLLERYAKKSEARQHHAVASLDRTLEV